MVHTYYPIGGSIGERFDQTFAGTGTNNDEGDQYVLGTQRPGNDGTKWMRVHAAEAITQYDAVAIDESFEARQLTIDEAGDNHRIGFAVAGAASDNDFFWVCLEGIGVSVAVLEATNPDVALYSTSTGGVLSSVSTEGSGTARTEIVGVTLTATAASVSGTRSPTDAMVNYPHVNL